MFRHCLRCHKFTNWDVLKVDGCGWHVIGCSICGKGTVIHRPSDCKCCLTLTTQSFGNYDRAMKGI